MERYYFETEDKSIMPNEICRYLGKIIGSKECFECERCFGIDVEESWIKCEIYSLFIENENLKDKIKQLDREIFLLKGGA